MKGLAIALCAFLLLQFPAAKAKSNIRLEVEPFYQTNYQRPLFEYEGEERSVSSSGCGATCITMVVAYLFPKRQQTPETQLLLACERGLYYGNGLSYKALDYLLMENGLAGEWIGNEPKQIRQALRACKPIIAYMGPGTFTKTGHYVVISGIDRNDRVWVIDPNSKSRSMRWYSLDMIFEEVGNNHGFLICQKAEPS